MAKTLIILLSVAAIAALGCYLWPRFGPTSASTGKSASLEVRDVIKTMTQPQAETEVLRDGLRELVEPSLNTKEVDQLAAFLLGERPPQIQLRAWHAYVNDVVEKLAYDHLAPDRLTGLLVKLYHHPSQDEVLRDYALQHLGSWYWNADPTAAVEEDPARRQQILDTLLSAAQQFEHRWSATALLSLGRIIDEGGAKNGALLTTEDLTPILTLFIQDQAVHPLAQIVALRMAAQAEIDGAIEKARALASDQNAVMSQRLAAIAVVGDYGHSDDEKWLDSMMQTGDRANFARLKRALLPAKQRLLARVQTKNEQNR